MALRQRKLEKYMHACHTPVPVLRSVDKHFLLCCGISNARDSFRSRESIPQIEASDDDSDGEDPFEGQDCDDKDVHVGLAEFSEPKGDKTNKLANNRSYHTHIIATPIV